MPLFQINNKELKPIRKHDFKYEKDLQKLTEDNLETLFNLKFVATEFQIDNLRIDTLAFNEETKSFVIIEYKKGKSYSVIDQGYSYLSLLLNNKAEFVLKFNHKFNTNYGKEDIDFSQSIVMFIAPHFTTYQLKSTEFNDLPFELWKVSKFEDNLVLYDQINVSEKSASIKEVKTNQSTAKTKIDREIKKYTEEDLLQDKPQIIKDLYANLKDKLLNEFDDLEAYSSKIYLGFKLNKKTLLTLTPYTRFFRVWFNVEKGKLHDPEGKTRDVSNIGHYGMGDYELKLTPDDDLYYVMSLFKQVYEEKS